METNSNICIDYCQSPFIAADSRAAANSASRRGQVVLSKRRSSAESDARKSSRVPAHDVRHRLCSTSVYRRSVHRLRFTPMTVLVLLLVLLMMPLHVRSAALTSLDTDYLFAVCSSNQQCSARFWLPAPDSVATLAERDLNIYKAAFAEMLPVAMTRLPTLSGLLLPQINECALEYSSELGDECSSVQLLFTAALTDMSPCAHPNEYWQANFGCVCHNGMNCHDGSITVDISDLRIVWVLPAIAIVFVIIKIVFRERDMAEVLTGIRKLNELVRKTGPRFDKTAQPDEKK